jgi:hypothetical protein
VRLIPARIPGLGDKLNASYSQNKVSFYLHVQSIVTWSLGVWFSQFDLLYHLESAPKNIWAEEGKCGWKFKKLREGELCDLEVSPAYF